MAIFPKLTKLKVNLHDDDFKELLNDLKTSVYNFHACFADTSTVIEISYGCSKVTTSKDRIFIDDEKPLLGFGVLCESLNSSTIVPMKHST